MATLKSKARGRKLTLLQYRDAYGLEALATAAGTSEDYLNLIALGHKNCGYLLARSVVANAERPIDMDSLMLATPDRQALKG